MKSKTIKKVIEKKIEDWLATVEDELLRAHMAQNIIVTGGSICSMLLKEPVNAERVTDESVDAAIVAWFRDETRDHGFEHRMHAALSAADAVRDGLVSGAVDAFEKSLKHLENAKMNADWNNLSLAQVGLDSAVRCGKEAIAALRQPATESKCKRCGANDWETISTTGGNMDRCTKCENCRWHKAEAKLDSRIASMNEHGMAAWSGQQSAAKEYTPAAAVPDNESISAISAAMATLTKLGYVWNGGELFDPPAQALASNAGVPSKELTAWADIEILRRVEGDSINILCDNPEGLCAVDCCGGWTNYLDRRFQGETVFDALEAARNAYLAAPSPQEVKKES